MPPGSGPAAKDSPPRGHPLGPLILRTRYAPSVRGRGGAALLLVGCVAVLALARWLQPDPRGSGTHVQLGHPPCSWLVNYGIPCPACGMTTAFALCMHGRLAAGFHAQPCGALLALLTVVVAGAAAGEVATGRGWRVNWYRVRPGLVVRIGLVLLAAGWIHKVLSVRGEIS